MQSIETMKCNACGAVVNPNWKACLVCGHPLNNHKPLDSSDIEDLFKVLKMTLSDFKKAGLLIRIKSRFLGGTDTTTDKPEFEGLNNDIKVDSEQLNNFDEKHRREFESLSPDRQIHGQYIYLASSEKEAATGKAEGLVTYTADELLNLIRGKATPEEVKAIHQVKTYLGGVITEVTERKEPKNKVSKGKGG